MQNSYFVKYLGGVALYPEPNEGALIINEKTLEFNAKRLNFKIPIEQIVDIATVEADDLKKAAGSYLALGMIGLAATRDMSKVRLMKVTFRDIMGGLQSPEFRFLPKSVKETNFYQEAANELKRLRQNSATSQSLSQPFSSPTTNIATNSEKLKQIESQPISPTTISKSHRSRNFVIIAAVGILIVVLVVSGILFTASPKTMITGMNLKLQYPNSDDLYFGAISQSIAIGNQPSKVLEINKGQQFYLSFSFTESSLATASHSITGMTATTEGFTIVSVSPDTPITLTPGSSIMITITFQSPDSYYTGAVDVAFTTG